MSKKLLIAFDFDDTLLDANSDMVVHALAPTEIPPEIKCLRKSTGWTQYMNEIFQHLHKNHVPPADILSCIGEVLYVSGMPELLCSLSQSSADVIVISDANSVFIDHSLKNANLSGTVNKVYTNPAWFDEAGRLHIEGYHKQDWCSLSTWNMCKGHILTEHINERKENGITYEHVAYVGDGSNDLCPSLRLSENDLVFPRKGFRLIEEIEKNGSLLAKVIPWESGLDIMKTLQLPCGRL